MGQCFSNAERIPVNLESYTQQKHSTVKKVKSKHPDEKKLRYASYRPTLKEKLKFTRQIETNKQKKTHKPSGRKKEKLWLNVRDFASPLEFAKVCFIVEAKITTLSKVGLNI